MSSTNAADGHASGISHPASTVTGDAPGHLHLVGEPSPAMVLSPVEQSGPRGYTRPIYFFPVPKDVDLMEAIDILRKGLEPTKKAIPALASELVRETINGQTGVFVLRPGNFGTLLVKDLRGTGLVYEELKQQNFPTSRLDPSIFCDTPIFPAPGDQLPVFVPRVSIIDGGLMLTVALHHAVFDAQGYMEIFRVWAQNCYHLQDKSIHECSSLPVEMFMKDAHLVTRPQTAETGRPEHHPEFLIAPEPITFGEAAFRESHRTRIYRITPKALAELKNDCTEDGKPWISTNDAVNALIWRSVFRAQLDPKQSLESFLSHLLICIDGRPRSNPPLRKDYIGCPMVYARPGVDSQDLVGSPDLASLAQKIRVAVDKVDAANVDSLVTLLNSIPGFDHWAPATFPLLMGPDVMISTWYRLDLYDINWGPALGHIDRIRFPRNGMLNGCTMIFPQVTKAKGQEGMEVSVGLDQAHFKNLEADPLWSKYAVPTDPGYDSL